MGMMMFDVTRGCSRQDGSAFVWRFVCFLGQGEGVT